MAVNFWEAQRRARSKTTLFLFLFAILTAIAAILVEFGMRSFESDYSQTSIPWVGLLFTLITFSVAGFQYLNFRMNGGGYVAESLGARKVNPETSDFHEKQLLNIVEEMALASSLPKPAVYILPARQINAFAAGLTKETAAITITEGSLQLLDRDELQGVVAHEFGHIYNGDMRISMRLAAMIMGFFFVLYLGLRLLQFTSYRRRGGGKSGGNPIAAAAFLFIIAGAFTWLFGSLLKASVSREREYLADACSVQFTRNPDGIIQALRKIEVSTTTDMPSHGGSYSHMYFNERSRFFSLFETHPSTTKRISAIIGREYIPDEWNIPAKETPHELK